MTERQNLATHRIQPRMWESACQRQKGLVTFHGKTVEPDKSSIRDFNVTSEYRQYRVRRCAVSKAEVKSRRTCPVLKDKTTIVSAKYMTVCRNNSNFS